MASLIVSPHLDDAILSLGGYLQSNNDENNTIITLFNTAWTAIDENMDYASITSMNLKEELTVVKKIGCKHIFLGYDEALLRGYKQWNEAYSSSNDQKVFYNVVNEIKSILNNNKYNEIFFPMAIGEHVDHVMVYEVAKLLLDFCAEKYIEILFYEDLPYASYGGVSERIQKVSKDFDIIQHSFEITEYFEEKCNYLKIYRSQLMLQDIDRIKRYVKHMDGDNIVNERVWRVNGRHKR
jgi:LmbE family N-acetylglucosaminyl deacetylase